MPKRKGAQKAGKKFPKAGTPAKKKKVEEKFSLPPNYRGVFKLYGDPTCHPCGGLVVVDEHYRNCGLCAPYRLFFDKWQEGAWDRSTKEDKIEVPALGYGVIDEMCRELGCSVNDFQHQEDGWTPFDRMVRTNAVTGRIEYHEKSFVELWNSFSYEKQLISLRSSNDIPPGCTLTDADKMYPLYQRRDKTVKGAQVYVLEMAMKDGAIPKEYVQKCLENYGAYKKGHELHKDFSEVAGVDVEEPHHMFGDLLNDVDNEDDGKLEEDYASLLLHECSPRLIMHRAKGADKTSKPPVPHDQDERIGLLYQYYKEVLAVVEKESKAASYKEVNEHEIVEGGKNGHNEVESDKKTPAHGSGGKPSRGQEVTPPQKLLFQGSEGK